MIIYDLKNKAECSLPENSAAALGNFDGVHIGHRRLFDALGHDRPRAVFTFSDLRRPGDRSVLCEVDERLELIAQCGVSYAILVPFEEVRGLSPEQFCDMLCGNLKISRAVCGFNFTFGAGGKGNGQMLKEYGKKHGFRTVIVPEVVIDGETVSSTRIRRLLAQGDMHEVNNLLGRGYSIAGRVEEGKQVGRTIGFPTANITIPPHKALPAFGVYACYLETSGGIFPAVVNVGRHPTLPEGHVTVEAHVLDEFLSLYGRNVRLTFLKFMRPEQKFDSIETLRAQIAHDADDCRAYFAQLQ